MKIINYLVVASLFMLSLLSGCTPTPVTPTPYIPQPTIITLPYATTPIAQPTPLTPTEAISGLTAVIEIDPSEVLNVRQSPGLGAPILVTLAYDAADLKLTGQQTDVEGIIWVEINLPDGQTGWVDRTYLTGQKLPADFCSDPLLPAMLVQFKQAVANKDGALLSSLISPWHGLQIQFYNGSIPVPFTRDQTAGFFTSTENIFWGIHPASGLEKYGTFSDIVYPTLSNTLNIGGAFECNPAGFESNYTFQWQPSLENMNHLSIYKPGTPGTELDWDYWWIGVEYVNEQPYLYDLLHFAWEP